MTGPSPRAQRRMAWAERMFARWGAPMIFLAYFIPFLPQWLCLIAAGEIRMRIWVVALADGLGALCFVLLCVLRGWYIGKPAIDVATTISHYGLYLTIALIAIVFVVSFRRALAQQAQHAPAALTGATRPSRRAPSPAWRRPRCPARWRGRTP